MLGTSTMLISFIEHTCGLLKIARYEYGDKNEHNNLNCYKKFITFIKNIMLKKVCMEVYV